ncbi:MAG: adenosylcobinamide-phosphate synthase CbiB [Desulfobacterales bacterium]
MDFSFPWYVLPAAFFWDLLIGDPQFSHHPVRYMGKAIEFAEPRFRQLPFGLRISGALFALFLVSGTWAAAVFLLALCGGIHPFVKTLAQILLVYFCISCRGLESAAKDVHAMLRHGNLPKAKEKLAMIVGRDVRNLSETGIARAAVETVAENLVDGVLSPLFFLLIGGVPLMVTYKMVNTLDSMVGYKNEMYKDFGMVSARMDDAANYLPARISVFVIALAAFVLNRRGKRAFETGRGEGRNHSSPNSGFSEAAFAGALGVKLGGPNVYHGKTVIKPFIGKAFGEVHAGHIPKACDLMVLSAFLFCMAVWLAELI